MSTSQHLVQTGATARSELTSVIGDAENANRIILVWCGIAAQFGGAAADLFTGPDPESDALRAKKLSEVEVHIDALTKLLDHRTSWLVACATPGFYDGPEVAEETEDRIAALVSDLERLRVEVARAARAVPAPKRGRKVHLSPRVMLMVTLVAELTQVGIPFSVAENSKMVRAARILWAAVEFEGDPRDLLRTFHKQKGA